MALTISQELKWTTSFCTKEKPQFSQARRFPTFSPQLPGGQHREQVMASQSEVNSNTEPYTPPDSHLGVDKFTEETKTISKFDLSQATENEFLPFLKTFKSIPKCYGRRVTFGFKSVTSVFCGTCALKCAELQ